MGTFIDLSGQRFGKLLVKSRAASNDSLVRWDCLCDCGQETIASTKKLRNGRKQSCGCLWLPAVVEAKTKHGHASNGRITTELRIWMNMRNRCSSPTNPSYPDYGGRGIEVCERWNDFGLFFADMGPRPSPAHTIDRKDNDGDYEPDNCRWATKIEQSRNKRSNVNVIFDGVEMCVTEAATLTGLNPSTILWRINAGWPESELFAPLKR